MATYIPTILILTFVSQTHQSPNYIPTYLFLTRVGPCQGDATVIGVNEMTITRQQYNFSVSGRLNITRDIPEGWLIRATMQKCQDIRNMDTCDHFKSYTAIENACTADELTGDKALYESVFNISTPNLSCPVKAGIYQIKNYPFVTRNNHLMVSESKISTSVFGYTLRLDGYSEDEKIMCIEAYMQLVYSRNQLGKDNGSEDNDSAEDKLAEDDNPDDNNADDDDNDEDDDSKANGKDKDETGTEDSKDDDNGSDADAVEDEDNSKVNDDKANNTDSNADDDKAYDGDSDSDGTQPKELSKTEGANADDGDSDDLTPNNEDDDTTGDENVGHDEGDESE